MKPMAPLIMSKYAAAPAAHPPTWPSISRGLSILSLIDRFIKAYGISPQTEVFGVCSLYGLLFVRVVGSEHFVDREFQSLEVSLHGRIADVEIRRSELGNE